jgi:Core-2/I-Branching enzyme
LAPLANVHFLERHRCYYGGFGHVGATLKGISEIFRRRVPFDYAILLTGQDYPIKSNREIDAFLAQHDGRSFLEHFQLPSEEWDFHGLDRIDLWHVRVRGRYFRFPQRPRMRIRRRFPPNLQPFGGSAYWCLPRESTEYIHRFLQLNPSYVRFFKYVNVPEEMFFHTIILNSPLRESVVNDDLRYLEWRDPAVAGGPAVLTKSDLGNIMSSPKLFARKFDMTKDSEVLDMIDATICGD